MDKQKTLSIRARALLRLGIDPQEGIDYLENKQAVTINPVHVKALQVLKQKPAVASS